MKEDIFIKIIKEKLPCSSSFIGDDTAYIEDKGLILTQDTLIEDIHFRMSSISPFELGYKAIAVNLSDIAASGGIPKYLLISLSLPPFIDENFIREFYDGVSELCTKHNTLVVGGDITGSEKICISVTAIAMAEGITPSTRKSAQIGDSIIVTGVFGASAAGLWLLENNINSLSDVLDFVIEKFKKCHKMPLPQIGFGRIIANLSQPAPVIMDASDGLADALYKISKCSNVSMEIDYEKIPFDPDLNIIAEKAGVNPVDWILFGGEDYQLVACVNEKCYSQLIKNNIAIRLIGKVVKSKEQSEVYVKNNKDIFVINQDSLDKNAFNHFKGVLKND
ncbi:MAG: thiamine-phosphate kinase [Candidatus Gastranaerophilaceae bacterium]|jgi:thiamine-monophosphate kinase